MRKNVFWIVALALVAMVFSNQSAESARLLTLNRTEGPFETTAFQGSATTPVSASIGNFGPKQILYGFNVTAHTTNGVASIYDYATANGADTTQGVFIDEGGAASQGDTWQSNWPAPYELQTDLTIITNGNATVVVYHDRK